MAKTDFSTLTTEDLKKRRSTQMVLKWIAVFFIGIFLSLVAYQLIRGLWQSQSMLYLFFILLNVSSIIRVNKTLESIKQELSQR